MRQTLHLAEPATHVEDAVNSIKVARKRRSTGAEAAQPVSGFRCRLEYPRPEVLATRRRSEACTIGDTF